MKLGELEFKAEDFDCHFDCTEKQHNVDCYARDNAERANKLLAERLEKAIPLFGHATIENGELKSMALSWDVGVKAGEDTHWGRIVCIEELPK